MLKTTKVYRWYLNKNPLKQKINIFSIQAIRSAEWLNCLFIFKSYNFVFYYASFSGLFSKILPKYGLVLPTESSNQLRKKKKQKEL